MPFWICVRYLSRSCCDNTISGKLLLDFDSEMCDRRLAELIIFDCVRGMVDERYGW